MNQEMSNVMHVILRLTDNGWAVMRQGSEAQRSVKLVMPVGGDRRRWVMTASETTSTGDCSCR